MIGLLGLLAIGLGVTIRGDGSGIARLFGLLRLCLAAWLLLNASEQSPGGISIEFRHETPLDVRDTYLLPESQEGTARAVVRQVGGAHEPPLGGRERCTDRRRGCRLPDGRGDGERRPQPTG